MTAKNSIYGTWDFKWPRGTQLRVAFQDFLPTANIPSLGELIAQYTEIASRWLSCGANIGFDFNNDRILPPPIKEIDPQTKELTLSGRSQRTSLPVAYDILVSFAPVPTFVFLDGDPQQTSNPTGQLSVLGSYAKRVHYGIPTTIVGPNRDFLPLNTTFKDYFNSRFYEHIVLHEVGHVLGMAHQHQNPLYRSRPSLKSETEIGDALTKIRTDYRTKFDAQVSEEIRSLWPGLPQKGNSIPYSDWSELNLGAGERLEDRTVMAHPIWSDLVVGNFPPAAAPLTAPTKLDATNLIAMYGYK